jgi:cell division septum initiation protein DivIVA
MTTRGQRAARVTELEAALTGALGQRDHLETELTAVRAACDQAQDDYNKLAREREQLRETITALAAEWEGEADAEDTDAANEPARDSRAAMQAEAIMQRECAAALRKLAAS